MYSIYFTVMHCLDKELGNVLSNSEPSKHRINICNM